MATAVAELDVIEVSWQMSRTTLDRLGSLVFFNLSIHTSLAFPSI